MAAEIRVDAGRAAGTFRAIHGVNGGPICYGGLVDLSKRYQRLGVPMVRVHDSNWPARDVVDIHAIFPNFRANPEEPSNYRFAPTDDYLRSIQAVGAGVVYRLGESIEHTQRQYYVQKPADFEQWAKICLGVIRHYNEGWGDGLKLNLRYFEIWNEPEAGPRLWHGSHDDYFRLYATSARAIKSRWPELKVGGPAACYPGKLDGEAFTPTRFVRGFLEYCRKEQLPLDFFSWHLYTSNPSEHVRYTRGLRRLLDEYGFAKTELHLNEWNYLPGNDWGPFERRGAEELQKWFEEIGSIRAAAFDAYVLLALQDAPVEMCNFYSGENGGFGLFTHFGVPKKSYYAFEAFKLLADHPRRVWTEGGVAGETAAAAGLAADGKELVLMVGNYRSAADKIRVAIENVPWQGPSRVEVRVLDDRRSLEELVHCEAVDRPRVELLAEAAGPSVVIVRVTEGIAR